MFAGISDDQRMLLEACLGLLGMKRGLLRKFTPTYLMPAWA